MPSPKFIMLYVDNPAKSAEFYAMLLDQPPCEISPTFAMFIIDNGYKLGLWSKHSVEPSATITGGGGELGFPLSEVSEVDALYAEWLKKGIKMAQSPTQMDFGYTFVALDPDGHRLRVYSYNTNLGQSN
jgi:predicted lactoylglutathione lyase